VGVALIIALLIGIAFGFVLERAGLGSAPKLAGQFYLTDFTVMKVMFTAIVVAMTGAFWLGRLGVLDLASVYVPETFLLPQIAGGAIFGVGFLVAGLCPGTSCVAAATGRGDGVAVMTGMFAGVLLTGLSFASLRQFYESTSYGVWTVPQLLHVPYGLVVSVLILAAFFVPLPRERVREAGVRGVIAVIAIITAFAGSPYMTRYVDPLQLASWIKDRKPGLEIVDTRSPQEFATVHVPGSQNVKSEPRDAIVVRADGGVYLLRGGIDGWVNNVLKAPRPTPLTRYFGGVRRGGC
jgi:uncharacterized membrane protein YedE/YeeE